MDMKYIGICDHSRGFLLDWYNAVLCVFTCHKLVLCEKIGAVDFIHCTSCHRSYKDEGLRYRSYPIRLWDPDWDFFITALVIIFMLVILFNSIE